MITLMLMCDLHGWVWATLSQILVINRVRVLGSGPHTPTQLYLLYVVHFLVVKVINKKLSFYKL